MSGRNWTPLLRALAYCMGLLVTMWAAAVFFTDTYEANLCLFGLFSVAFEFLTDTEHLRLHRRLFLGCVVLAALAAGVILSFVAQGKQP